MAFQAQSSLFGCDQDFPEKTPDITYIPEFTAHHQQWFDRLVESLHWNIQFKSRKTYTFGVSYNYRKGTKKAREMPQFLTPVCNRIQQTFGYNPNNCLVNFYPSGENYISLHSDQDTEMKARTGVTIISLGSLRTMVLRNIESPNVKHHFPLQPGSAIFMEDAVQAEWQHGIPKESGSGPRISLSFRSLIA